MPFTLAHAAAVLPLRRLRLITSGLFVGAFAPDFEYFLRLAPNDAFGHTLIGTFVITLPLSLLVLWLFHVFIRLPLIGLLPDGVQRRLTNHLREFHFEGSARFALIIVSILLGIATHLVWDSFTHSHTWVYDHLPVLRRLIYMPIAGSVPVYKVLPHGSTAIGITILVSWLVLLYRDTEPSESKPGHDSSAAHKVAISAFIMTAAVTGAIVRAVASTGFPTHHLPKNDLSGFWLLLQLHFCGGSFWPMESLCR